MTETQQQTLRAMVREIGSEPQQDMHFDAWFYPGQSPQVFGLQKYEQSVTRKFVQVLGGESPSPALVALADSFLAGFGNNTAAAT